MVCTEAAELIKDRQTCSRGGFTAGHQPAQDRISSTGEAGERCDGHFASFLGSLLASALRVSMKLSVETVLVLGGEGGLLTAEGGLWCSFAPGAAAQRLGVISAARSASLALSLSLCGARRRCPLTSRRKAPVSDVTPRTIRKPHPVDVTAPPELQLVFTVKTERC